MKKYLILGLLFLPVLAFAATSVPWIRSGTNTYSPYPGDNVGIGTASPSEKLDVSGNIHVDGDATLTNGNNFITGNTGEVITNTVRAVDNSVLTLQATGNAGSVALNATNASVVATQGGIIQSFAGNGNTSGIGGSVESYGGTGGSSGIGGKIYMQAGNGGSSSGAGGNAEIYAGNGSAGNANGGHILLSPGTKNGTGKNGNVGIGTSTPWANLSINPIAGAGSAPSFAIGSSTGTKLVVTNSGNVGIATSSPWQPLTVNGNIFTNGRAGLGNATIDTKTSLNVLSPSDGGQVDEAAVRGTSYNSPGNYGILGWDDNNGGSESTAGVYGASNGTGVIGAGGSIGGNFTGSYGINASGSFIGASVNGGIYGLYSSGGLNFFQATTSIASSTPWAKFSLDPTQISGVQPSFAIGSGAGRTQFVVTNSGNVGIGTAIPGNQLSITKSGGLSIFDVTSYNTGGSDRSILFFRTAQGTEASPSDVAFGDQLGEFIGSGYAGGNFRNVVSMSFGVDTGTVSGGSLPAYIFFETTPDGSTSRVERMRISSTGNVGIGTTSPYANLSVQSGASTGDAFVVATSSKAAVFGIDNDGHTFTSGPAPVISSCGTGTGTVVGNDQSGVITTATAATSCTATFAKAYRVAPVCTVSDDSTAGFPDVSSVSTTAVTFGISSALTGGKLYYHCEYTKN